MDLFEVVLVCPTFLADMADILSKGILSACNDLDCCPIRRGSAANFASNSCLIGVNVEKRILVPAYLLKEALNKVFFFL